MNKFNDYDLQLYREMLRIRLVEERLADIYPQQKIRCPMHLSIGQEAVAVGVCSSLREQDGIFSTHRAHAHYLAKGGSLPKMIAEMYGKESGCCGGIGGSMHLIDLSVNMLGSTPIVGGSLPVAVGTAFANKLKGSDAVTVCFFGDGMTEEGVFSESLNFSAVHELSILFVCENNLYSVYSPLSVRQHEKRSITGIADAHGVHALHADGNSIHEVVKTSDETVSSVRSGNGPALIEYSTYRWRAHCGPDFDNDIGYRDEAEYLEWKKTCPIAQLKESLFEEKILNADLDATIYSQINEEIDDAIAFAEDSLFSTHNFTENPLYA